MSSEWRIELNRIELNPTNRERIEQKGGGEEANEFRVLGFSTRREGKQWGKGEKDVFFFAKNDLLLLLLLLRKGDWKAEEREDLGFLEGNDENGGGGKCERMKKFGNVQNEREKEKGS